MRNRVAYSLSILAIVAGVTNVFAVSNLMQPRECRVVKSKTGQVGFCDGADKTAGGIAVMSSIALIVLGYKGITQESEVETTPRSITPLPPPLPQEDEYHPVSQTSYVTHATGEELEEMPQSPKDALWAKLHNENYGWLLQLLQTKPLLVWGEQCSGKTKFSAFLAMLRMVFFNHKVTISDPHSHQNSWPAIWDCYGSQYNYQAINRRLEAYYDRLKKGNEPHTSIWDEVTNYAENCDENLAGRFLKSILSDVRKPPEFPILLSHSNTLNALGGGKGGVKTMQVRGLVEVNLRAKRDRLGNLQPALKGTITGLNFDDNNQPMIQQITLEPWMQPEWLMSQFPELGKTTEEKKDMLILRVHRLINEGVPQTEIIKEIWKVSPGESSRYDDALKKYREIKGVKED